MLHNARGGQTRDREDHGYGAGSRQLWTGSTDALDFRCGCAGSECSAESGITPVTEAVVLKTVLGTGTPVRGGLTFREGEHALEKQPVEVPRPREMLTIA